MDSKRDTGTPENKSCLDFRFHLCQVIVQDLNQHRDNFCQTTWLSKSYLSLPCQLPWNPQTWKGEQFHLPKVPESVQGWGKPRAQALLRFKVTGSPAERAAQHPSCLLHFSRRLLIQDTLQEVQQGRKASSDGRALQNCHQSCLHCSGFLPVESWCSSFNWSWPLTGLGKDWLWHIQLTTCVLRGVLFPKRRKLILSLSHLLQSFVNWLLGQKQKQKTNRPRTS